MMDKDFTFKKSLGQNFLKDENIINKIVDSANIDKDTLLLEVGPGGGAITKKMVPLCRNAILYEADDRLEDHLNKLLNNYDNYEIKIGDFLKANILDDISRYEYNKLYLVANLPYYITTPIIMKFIDENVLPDKMVIMVQKEVADRLSAKPNTRDYGSLTVLLNYFYNIKTLFTVSRNCFIPSPNVDSAIVCFELKDYLLDVKDIEVFKKVVRDSFMYKRKNIRNNLKGYDLNVVENLLKKYNCDLSVRAESLDLYFFVELANVLNDKVKNEGGFK